MNIEQLCNLARRKSRFNVSCPSDYSAFSPLRKGKDILLSVPGRGNVVWLRLRPEGLCALDASVEIINGLNPDAVELWLSDKGLEMNARNLNRAFNALWKERFHDEMEFLSPGITRKAGCYVEQVHSHRELLGFGGDHIHFKCRRTLPCLDALDAGEIVLESARSLQRR